MSFLKKMFGSKDPVEELRQLHANQDWAGLLSVAKRLDREPLEEELRSEISAWEDEAGDALATINLEEGVWAQKSDNLLRAREDYQLAMEQARSPELRKRIEQALLTLDRGELPPADADTGDGPAIHAGCSSSCTTAAGPEFAPQEMDLDEEARLELLLATMPADLAQRYMTAGMEFRQAWLATQDGEDQQALELLDKIPKEERNALFLFERGALMARSGENEKARQDLLAALTTKPEHFTAFDALVDVLASTGQVDELEKLLKQNLEAGLFGGYCWARLAEIHAQRGELEPALASGLKAVDEGVVEPGLIILCAQLLERSERFDEAEAQLMRLSGKGCGGGAHPMLAEFWLRRGQNFNMALEAFKGALRQERDNPRWLLRIAQVYLAKGWKKEASAQIEMLMKQGNLPDQVRNEVNSVAEQLRLK
jgi:tetratricopeptide (TPR) repeat protein